MFLHDRKFSAHKNVRPPERKKFSRLTRGSPSETKVFFFLLTGGRGSCRAAISASRQIGKSVGRDVSRKISAHQRFALQNESFSAHWRARLLPSRNFGKSAGRQIGRSGCRQKISAHLEVRPPERKFFCSLEGEALPSRDFSRSASRQIGKSAGRDAGRKFRLTWKFALQKICIFVATKIAHTVNFVFRAKLFRWLRRCALREATKNWRESDGKMTGE